MRTRLNGAIVQKVVGLWGEGGRLASCVRDFYLMLENDEQT